jgi:hypothetical protein
MWINVENMLRQAGNAAGDRYGYRFSLGELAKHLKELRDRSLAGDDTAIKEFFGLYIFDDGQDYRERQPTNTGERNG